MCTLGTGLCSAQVWRAGSSVLMVRGPPSGGAAAPPTLVLRARDAQGAQALGELQGAAQAAVAAAAAAAVAAAAAAAGGVSARRQDTQQPAAAGQQQQHDGADAAGGGGASHFDSKTDRGSADLYFHYYGCLQHQQNMLQDYIRTGTYHAAIAENPADFAGKVVMDVGCGSGILSLFAAQVRSPGRCC